MTNSDLLAERKLAIFQLVKGKTIGEAAQCLDRSPNWVWKWHKRYREDSWSGLKERSRAPKCHGNKLPETVRQAVRQARLELEAEASLGEGLKYVGALAVRTRLKKKHFEPLPSITSIERILRDAGMTKPKEKRVEPQVKYPHLKPAQAHQLCQVDIVPHFLSGGKRVSCFNAIDVVSRYPTGQPYARRRSEDAAAFLIHTWQEIGIPRYTQVDNEGCFSGGATHKHVLGKVVRLALEVGTELVFSPVRHPESNGSVERFHQDYDRHVWEDTYLDNMDEVLKQSQHFFRLYRQREDHSKLNEQSPEAVHSQQPMQRLAPHFALSEKRRPLKAGCVHFIRRVSSEGKVRVLNDEWAVPNPDTEKGVWVTIEFLTSGATLRIFDAAPDRVDRRCLASYPFSIDEAILPRTDMPARTDGAAIQLEIRQITTDHQQRQRQSKQRTMAATVGGRLISSAINRTARLTSRIFHTMY
jgi:transposase InsO family protein